MKSFLVVVFCVAAGFNGVLCADRTLKRYPRQVEYAEGNVANSGHSPDVHGNYAVPSFPRQATSASYPGDLSAFLTTSPIPSSRDTDRKASRQVRRIDDSYPPQSFSPQSSYQTPPTSTVLFPGPSTIPQQQPSSQLFPSRYQPTDYTVDALPPSHFSAAPPPAPNQNYVVQNQQQSYSPPPPPPNHNYVQSQQQSYSPPPPPPNQNYAQNQQQVYSPPTQFTQGPSIFSSPIQDSQPSFRPTAQDPQPNFPPRPDVDLPPQIPLTFSPRPSQEPPRFPPRPDLDPPPRDARFSTRPDVRGEPNLPPRPDVDILPPRNSNSLTIRPESDVPARRPLDGRPNQDIAPNRNYFSQPDTNFSPPTRTAPSRPLTTPPPPPSPTQPPSPPPSSQFRPLPSNRPPPPVSLTVPGQSFRNIRQPLNTVAVPPHPQPGPIGASVAPFPFGDDGLDPNPGPPPRTFAPPPTARPPIEPPARPQPIAFPRGQEKLNRSPVNQPQEPPRNPPRRPIEEPEPRRQVPRQPISEPVPQRHVPRRVISEPTPVRNSQRQQVSEADPGRQSRRPQRVRAEVPEDESPKSFRIDTPLEFQRRPVQLTGGVTTARSNRSRQPISPPPAPSPAPTRPPRQPTTSIPPPRQPLRQPIQASNNDRNGPSGPRREQSPRDERPLFNPAATGGSPPRFSSAEENNTASRPLQLSNIGPRPVSPSAEPRPVQSLSQGPENAVRPPFSPLPTQRPNGAPIELPPGVPAVYDPNNPYPKPRKPLPGAPPPPPVPNKAQFPVLENLPYPKKNDGPELRPFSERPSSPNTQAQRRRNPIINNEAVPVERRPTRPPASPAIVTPIRTPTRDENEQNSDAERPKNKRRRKNRRRTTVAPTTASKDLGENSLTVPPQNLETASPATVVPSSTPNSLPKRRRNRRKKHRTTAAPDTSTADSSLEDEEAPPNRGRLGRNRI